MNWSGLLHAYMAIRVRELWDVVQMCDVVHWKPGAPEIQWDMLVKMDACSLWYFYSTRSRLKKWILSDRVWHGPHKRVSRVSNMYIRQGVQPLSLVLSLFLQLGCRVWWLHGSILRSEGNDLKGTGRSLETTHGIQSFEREGRGRQTALCCTDDDDTGIGI